MGEEKGKDICSMVVITYDDMHREEKKKRHNTSINRCSLFVVIRSTAQRDLFDEIADVTML
jgi:hypothetical protein